MIRKAGGKVVSSTFIGTDVSGSSPCHVILAEPPNGWPPAALYSKSGNDLRNL